MKVETEQGPTVAVDAYEGALWAQSPVSLSVLSPYGVRVLLTIAEARALAVALQTYADVAAKRAP